MRGEGAGVIGGRVGQCSELRAEADGQSNPCRHAIIFPDYPSWRNRPGIAKHAIASLAWLYVFIKLFIFDLDIAATDHFLPSAAFLIQLKSIISLFVVLFSLYCFRFPSIRNLILWVALYPLVIFLWQIPKLMFSNWPIAIVFAPAVYEFFRLLKQNVALFTLTSLACLIISITNNSALIVSAIIFMYTSVSVQLYRSFTRAYRSNVFNNLSDLVAKLRKNIESGDLGEKLTARTEIKDPTGAIIESEHGDLSVIYTVHSILESFAYNVNLVLKKHYIDFYLFFSWITLCFFSITSYAFMYWGVYKIDHAFFSGPPNSTFWSFLGFSLNLLTSSGVSTVKATSNASQILCYSQSIVCRLVLLSILIFATFTVLRAKYKEDSEAFIAELRRTGDAVGKRLNDCYQISMDQAEMLILSNHSALFTTRMILSILVGKWHLAVLDPSDDPHHAD